MSINGSIAGQPRTHLIYFICNLSSLGYPSHISEPYINISRTVLSNSIILILKSPFHLLSPKCHIFFNADNVFFAVCYMWPSLLLSLHHILKYFHFLNVSSSVFVTNARSPAYANVTSCPPRRLHLSSVHVFLNVSDISRKQCLIYWTSLPQASPCPELSYCPIYVQRSRMNVSRLYLPTLSLLPPFGISLTVPTLYLLEKCSSIHTLLNIFLVCFFKFSVVYIHASFPTPFSFTLSFQLLFLNFFHCDVLLLLHISHFSIYSFLTDLSL